VLAKTPGERFSIVRSFLAAGGVSTFDVVDEYLKEEESQ
jgi:hypothetical protein